MKKVKLLVVDNDSMIKALSNYFKDSNIEVSYKAFDGEEALDIIEKHNDIDMILLDLILPNKDGLYVLEKLKEKNIDKRIIVCSTFLTSDMIYMAGMLGASYIMSKPYDMNILTNRINTLIELPVQDTKKIVEFVDEEKETTITKVLHELGIPSHIKGYQYIKEGIKMIYDDNNLIGNITKKVYPNLADKYDTTSSRVERAIRHAIEVGWSRSNWKLTENLFGQSVDFDKAKPTNSEFLVTLADWLRFDIKLGVN